MNVKKQLGTAAAIATVALAVAAPVVATDTPASADPGVAYFRANERATIVQSPGQAAIAYFRANERATLVSEVSSALGGTSGDPGPLVSEVSSVGTGYVDGNGPVAEAALPVVEAEPTHTAKFDWQDAAVGASSALMLVLLVGGSLTVLRHSRGRELAR